MSRPVRAASAFLALMVLVTGCGGGSKSTAYPAPPGENTPLAEVSQNPALALAPKLVTPNTLKEMHDTLPGELVGDRANAIYSGQRLTGSSAAPATATTPALSAPAVPSSPRVPVEQQAASAALPAPPPAVSAGIVPPAPTVNLSGSGHVTVQLAAFRTRANAEGGWQRLRAAHPDQLGDRALIMRETDLGDRGIYYRVRTGPFSDVAAAKAFCAQLRSRDQDCIVIR